MRHTEIKTDLSSTCFASNSLGLSCSSRCVQYVERMCTQNWNSFSMFVASIHQSVVIKVYRFIKAILIQLAIEFFSLLNQTWHVLSIIDFNAMSKCFIYNWSVLDMFSRFYTTAASDYKLRFAIVYPIRQFFCCKSTEHDGVSRA